MNGYTHHFKMSGCHLHRFYGFFIFNFFLGCSGYRRCGLPGTIYGSCCLLLSWIFSLWWCSLRLLGPLLPDWTVLHISLPNEICPLRCFCLCAISLSFTSFSALVKKSLRVLQLRITYHLVSRAFNSVLKRSHFCTVCTRYNASLKYKHACNYCVLLS